ncbi:MAG: hypothetical protein U0X39_11850 [Bacteroidales bacterium]
MKKIALLFILSFVCVAFQYCEKARDGYLLPRDEVPGWLTSRIDNDELLIKEARAYSANYGAWLRFKWNNTMYFEYHNPVLSSLPVAVSFSGDTIEFSGNGDYQDYLKYKCCQIFVWKAPGYVDF